MIGNGHEAGSDRRWAMRRSIELDADIVDAAGLVYAAKVLDISEEGCMVRTLAGSDLVRDRLHDIKMIGMDALTGYVIWSEDGKAGIAFSEPLHTATVQNLVMKSHYGRISRFMAQKGATDAFTDLHRPFPFGK